MAYPHNQARLYRPVPADRTSVWRHPLHSSGMKELLGLDPKANLPLEGMDPVYIQGVKVWVNPEPIRRSFDRAAGIKVRKSSTHRVRCECPICGEKMSAGRLNQHTCK